MVVSLDILLKEYKRRRAPVSSANQYLPKCARPVTRLNSNCQTSGALSWQTVDHYSLRSAANSRANHPDDYVMVGPFPRRDPHDPETRKRRCCFELDAGDGMRLRVRQPDKAPVEARVIEMPTRNTYRVSIVGFEEGEHFEGQTYDVRIGEEVVVGASQMWAMWGAPAEA